jgi:hypothetical protein
VGFIGTDTFQYAISDGLSAPISATAEIEVLAVPVPTSDPAAEDDEGEVASEIASDALPVANSGIAIPGTSTSGLATTTTTTTTSSTRGDAIGAIVDNEIVNQLEAGEIQQQTWTRSFYTGLTSSPQAVEATIQVAITQLPYAPSNVAINVLNVLKEEVANESFVSQAVIGTTMFTATSISVGYVIWLIRGGVLLSSVLSSLPAWQMVDPLPVLGYLDEDEDELAGDETETDSSLEKLVAESNTAYDAIAVG